MAQGGQNNIHVTVNGALVAGSGTGIITTGTGPGATVAATGTDPGAIFGFATGVHLVGGNNNTLTNNGLIATADNAAGLAILGEGGNETVNNYGNTFGSVDLENGTTAFTNTFNNETSGMLQSGAVVYLGEGNVMNNSGTISPGAIGTLMSTALTGNYTQTGNAAWIFDINDTFNSDPVCDLGDCEPGQLFEHGEPERAGDPDEHGDLHARDGTEGADG